MSNITYFKDNLFDREIFSRKEIITMVMNLIKTIKLQNLSKKDLSDYELTELLEKIGLTDANQKISVEYLKKELGNKLYGELIDALSYVTLADFLDNVYLRKYSKAYRKMESTSLEQLAKPTLVDLFCGSGGLSLGLTQAGFRVIFANDIDKAALQTYSFNHPEVSGNFITMGGIETISKNIHNYIEEGVDVLAGGPPCQGFSNANRQRIIDDPRNKLYKYYVECVTSLQPKIFIMENVRGMLKVANQVVEDFNKSVEYDIYYQILNAREFDVPQNRERLIYIGIRKDVSDRKNITAEKVMNLIVGNKSTKNRPIADALHGLRPLKAARVRNNVNLENEEIGFIIDHALSNASNDYIRLINQGVEFKLVFNHKARYNNDRDIEIYGRMHPGDKADSPRIADIMPYKSRAHIFKDKYFKLIPTQPSKTITAHMKFDCNMYIHPSQARGLTPREAARIQSYPDDFFFQGAFTKTYQQIGNSVPPLLARAIGKQIIKLVY